nr:alpha/beta hydrolase [Microbacterium testaceum]
MTGLVPGSVEAAYEVAHLAAERERVASDLVDRLLRMREIDGWTGQAAEAYANRVASVARRWTEIGDGLSAVVGPLQTYARALSSAQGLAAQAIEAWAFASTLPETPGTPAGFSSFSRGWPVLVSDPRHRGPAPTTAGEARARAEAMVADACVDVKAAGDVATVAVRRAIEAVRARGEAWARVGEGLGVAALPPGRVLAMMRTLDADTLTDLLGARPDLLERLAQSNPADVAPWWRGLSSAQQDALIACAPGIIGNLGGVAYAARDRANRIVLAQALEEARNSPWDQSEQVAALEALDRAATGNTLASLVLDRPPLAQVAVGDLDRASSVTFLVPGMNTTVGRDMGTYVSAAARLRWEQFLASGISTDEIAVVAWLGYHPPVSDPLWRAPEVLADSRAEVGATALAYDIGSVRVAQELNGGRSNLSVVAHSYGTDVSTLALKHANADHLVLLGSAGVSDGIDAATDLKVPDGEVYATQSMKDGWAPVGQGLSQRTDPTEESFGARTFWSERSVVGGERLDGVHSHGPIGVGPQAPSYLDSGSIALRYAAMASMGAGEDIPEGGDSLARHAASGGINTRYYIDPRPLRDAE